MADIDWPVGPTTGQNYTSPDGDTWVWNGYAWDSLGNTYAIPTINVEEYGSPVGSRPTINFIGSTGVTINAVDDPGNNRVDVEIASSAEAVAIDVYSMQGLISSSSVSPDTLYRIYDAGVAAGAPGSLSDDSISGFYTRGIAFDQIESFGTWRFYPNAKSRGSVSFVLSQDTGDDATDVLDIYVGVNNLLTTTFTWTPGDNPNSFAASLQSDINGNTSITSWSCPTYNVYEISSVSGVTATGITLCLESLKGVVDNGNGCSSSLSTPANPSIQSTGIKTTGGADEEKLINLEASYDIDHDMFISAYDIQANVRIENGIESSGNGLGAHSFPWRSQTGDSEFFVKNCFFRNSQFSRGFGELSINNTEFINSFFGGKDNFSVDGLYMDSCLFENSSFILDTTTANQGSVTNTTFIDSTIQLAAIASVNLAPHTADFNIQQTFIKSSNINFGSSLHNQSPIIEIYWSNIVGSQILSTSSFKKKSSFSFNGLSMNNSVLDTSDSEFYGVKWEKGTVGEQNGLSLTVLENSSIFISSCYTNAETSFKFLGANLYNSSIDISNLNTGLTDTGTTSFDFTSAILRNSTVDLASILVEKGVPFTFSLYNYKKGASPSEIVNSTLSLNAFEINSTTYFYAIGVVWVNSRLDFSNSVTDIYNLEINITADLKSSFIYCSDAIYTQSSSDANLTVIFQGSLKNGSSISCSSVAGSMNYNASSTSNYINFEVDMDQSQINFNGTKVFESTDMLFHLTMHNSSSIAFQNYVLGISPCSIRFEEGYMNNSTISIKEFQNTKDFAMYKFNFTNCTANSSILIPDSTSYTPVVEIRNLNVLNGQFQQDIQDFGFTSNNDADQLTGLYILPNFVPSTIHGGFPLTYTDSIGSPISGTVSIGITGDSPATFIDIPSSDFNYTRGPLPLDLPNIKTGGLNQYVFHFDTGGLGAGGTAYGTLDAVVTGRAILY